MKKKPTIKNVLKELEHIEARILNLRKKVNSEKDIKYGTINLNAMLHNAFTRIDDAQDEVKSWITSKMLKDTND
jgi:hypothetical protein